MEGPETWEYNKQLDVHPQPLESPVSRLEQRREVPPPKRFLERALPDTRFSEQMNSRASSLHLRSQERAGAL